MHALAQVSSNVIPLPTALDASTKSWMDRQVSKNRPFNEDGALYAYGDAIGLGQPGVFVDRHSGGLSFTVGNAAPGTVLRIGAMSLKRRRVVKALELPVEGGWTFNNAPRDVKVRVNLTATDLRRMGIHPGVKLALQTLGADGRGDITWLPIHREDEIRPR
jgi:hypothetical protein